MVSLTPIGAIVERRDAKHDENVIGASSIWRLRDMLLRAVSALCCNLLDSVSAVSALCCEHNRAVSVPMQLNSIIRDRRCCSATTVGFYTALITLRHRFV